MKLFTFVWVCFALFLSSNLQSQVRNCGTMDVLDRQVKSNPFLIKNMEEIERQTLEFIKKNPKGLNQRAVVTIPVVFHIVSNVAVPAQNISDAQIQSQIDILNQDFRALNPDFTSVPSTFTGVAADAEVQFCLAQRDPNGNATTGITRKTSTVTYWGTTDNVKRSINGGTDPWNTANYLNIWVCRISQSNTSVILGYAQFPGGAAATDGVVIDFRFVGNIGTAQAPFNKGRTATHEIGHWLNLRHIWGDATCGNDLVSDTPVHNAANAGCPTHPHLSTCSGAPVEMTMNYMDYTNDACMYMFSAGQKARMQAVLASGGARAGLLCSPGCLPPGSSNACDAPTGINFTNTTQTSATANWSAAPNAVSYTVEYKPDYLSTWTVVSPNVVGTSYTMSGLLSGTFYNFRIKTNCTSGSSCGYSTAAFATASPPVPCNDAFETNNTASAAKSLTVGTTRIAAISTATDVDWFKFANSKSKKNIRVDLTNLPANYDVKLFRGTSTQVGISTNAGTTSELIKYNNTQSNTTYYVQIYGVSGAFDNFNCYNLLVQISGTNFREGVIGDGSEVELVENEFLIFPNPANEQVTLVVPFGDSKSGVLSVYDLTGKIISSENLTGDESQQTFNMDISQFRPGVYLVNFKTGDETYTQKMVVGDNK
jgi:hypothetical protein